MTKEAHNASDWIYCFEKRSNDADAFFFLKKVLNSNPILASMKIGGYRMMISMQKTSPIERYFIPLSKEAICVGYVNTWLRL